jgi:uncharacterized protein (TIGR02679 family)
MTANACRLCDGSCIDADLTTLLSPDLGWLWAAVAAAADRRGDPHLITGPAVTVDAPVNPSQRAAAAGLVRGALRPGRRLCIELDVLTKQVRARGPTLTPGAVAAHATGRTLATRAADRSQQRARAQRLSTCLDAACNSHPELAGRGPQLFEHLRRAGWVARLDGGSNADQLVASAVAVAVAVMRIPDGDRRDRRLLVPGSPHALDEGTSLAGVTLSLLAATGRISADPGSTARSLWAQAGVDCDQLMGGLAVLGLGIHPRGWQLPPAATCTLPPRELARPEWPTAPYPDAYVFITENPSVLAAAADMRARNPNCTNPIRLVCTMGNPSQTEISAIASLAAARWNIAVRADFDPAGIRNVTAVLNAVPRAKPWRMTAIDYATSRPITPIREPIPATPWEPELAEQISATGCVAFEEALMKHLLEDLRRGAPHGHDSDSP